MYVDVFYYLSFRNSNTGPMTLPTDAMQQCHHYVDQYSKVNSKLLLHTILYFIISVVLIF